MTALTLSTHVRRLRRDPVGTLALWFARASERRRLSRLSPCALRDVGLSADDARTEAARPFWDGAPR